MYQFRFFLYLKTKSKDLLEAVKDNIIPVSKDFLVQRENKRINRLKID